MLNEFFNNKTTYKFLVWCKFSFYLSFFHKIVEFTKLFQEYLPNSAALAHLILLPYLVLELTPSNYFARHQFHLYHCFCCQILIGGVLKPYSFPPHLVCLLYHHLYFLVLLMTAHTCDGN